MTALELAQKYYPALWNDARLAQLVQAGILSEEEVAQVQGVT